MRRYPGLSNAPMIKRTALALALCMTVTLAYRHIIAWLWGYTAMPIMDMVCFLADDKSPLNIMSCIMMTDKTDVTTETGLFKSFMGSPPESI